MTNPSADFDQRTAQILGRIAAYQAAGKRVFVSSSFQSQSVPLLHIISQCAQPVPVLFLNTGFLFAETHAFKRQLVELLGLEVVDLESPIPKNQQMDGEGKFLYTSDPDRCCYLNKTLPMEKPLIQYDVWISGVRRDQNANRAQLREEEAAPNDTLRYHPMLEWTAREIWAYIRLHKLPRHPLEGRGYLSIGCRPCTHKFEVMDEANMRGGRWSGMNKTECGLHTELISK